MNNQTKIKTVVIYGDSISTKEIGEGGYERFLKEQLQIPTIYNHAIGASGLTSTTPNNLSLLLDNPETIHENAELIIIWHGTNDWYWGSDLGQDQDMACDSFIGAINIVVNRLRTASPNAVIVWLTPLSRLETPDQCSMSGDAWTTQNKIGLTLKDYDTAVREAGRRLCFPVIDMRVLSGFHMESAHIFQPDGVHPSACGCKRIASVLSNQINLLSFE